MQSATRRISRSPAHVTLPHLTPSFHQSESSLPPIPSVLEGSMTLWTIVNQSDSMSQIKIFVFVYLSVFPSVQRVQGIYFVWWRIATDVSTSTLQVKLHFFLRFWLAHDYVNIFPPIVSTDLPPQSPGIPDPFPDHHVQHTCTHVQRTCTHVHIHVPSAAFSSMFTLLLTLSKRIPHINADKPPIQVSTEPCPSKSP